MKDALSGLARIDRADRKKQKEIRRKKRREKVRRAMDRLAVLAGVFGGHLFGTRKVGWVVAAVVLAIGGVIVWRLMG